MIFYYNEKNATTNVIQEILEELNRELTTQKDRLNILLQALNKINYSLQNTVDIENPKEVTTLLSDMKSNLDYTRISIENVKSLIDCVSTQNEDENDIKIKLQKYNELANLYRDVIYKTSNNFNACILKYMSCSSYTLINSDITEGTEETTSSKVEERQKENLFNKDNNVLLISETQKKVFLPYTIKALKKILIQNKTYNNIQEIIENEYTVPIENYRRPVKSRFRETYNLMRYKEKASKMLSFKIAFKLSLNSSLNPAIITACNNLDELYSYLDCLENDSINDFNFFKIQYEVLPRTNRINFLLIILKKYSHLTIFFILNKNYNILLYLNG